MRKALIFIGFLLALFGALLIARRARAQQIPGVASSAPQAWTAPGIIGRDVASGGDVPDLLLPSQAGATESLYQFAGTNGSAATRYVQVFKSNTVPANGTAPQKEIAVSAGVSFYYFGYPIVSLAATGFVIACSTSQGTLTLTSGNDCFISATISP